METRDQSTFPKSSRSSINFDTPQLRTDAITLERLLLRLSNKVLSDPPNPRLLHSRFERTKTAANIDFAQRLKLRLQENLPNTKSTHERKQQHAILAQYTSTIKQLRDRLQQLAQQDDGKYEDPDGEDLVAEYYTPQPATRPAVPAVSLPPIQTPILPYPDPSTPLSSHPPTLSPEQASALRNRFPQSASQPTSYTSQSNASQTSAPKALRPTTAQLESNTTTQTDLTSSLLTLAQQLKAQSHSFADSIENEKSLLDNTVSTLDKNTDGMQRARQNMGLLQRMSEGKGWFGRMGLYAYILALWVAALALVFVGPKFRF